MRHLPKNRSEKHNLIIRAANDFFGKGCPEKDRPSIAKTALYVMGRKRGLGKLNEMEQEAVWYIKNNLTDNCYK